MVEALSEKGVHLKMGAEGFPAVASVSLVEGQELGKCVGVWEEDGKAQRGEGKCVALFMEEREHWGGNKRKALQMERRAVEGAEV